MQHIQITIPTINSEQQDILIALLDNIGYSGFEQTTNSLLAYIAEENFNESELNQILQPLLLPYHKETIAPQNWNALWESNFEPVIIDNFVSIRAAFHQPITTTQHQIVITPKMSFGTGHHATTYTVMQLMQHINFNNTSVLDFGTGTGILAILAEKLGATHIVAIDNDDWCIENATENIANNNCSKIEIIKADTATIHQTFNIVIANINKNIIQENFDALHNCCQANTTVLLSGLLQTDENDILQLTATKNWKHTATLHKNNWIAMQFTV